MIAGGVGHREARLGLVFVEQAFAKMGARANPATPDELATYLAQQQARWGRIVETTRVSAD